MSKNYLGLIDSRNTKYQGLIRDDSFNGIGILMDNLFTTILSTWKKNFIDGPSVIIFPNMEVFFGQVQENIPRGLICFQVSQKQKYVIDFERDSKRSQQFSKSKIAHIVAKQSITHLQQQKQNGEYVIIQAQYCNKQDQEINFLSKIFQKEVLRQHVDLKSYLKTKFVEQTQQFQLSGRNELFFGFKNVNSLGFKFENNVITQVGNFNKFPKNLMFGRKVSYNFVFPSKTKIQQGYFQQPTETFTFLKQTSSTNKCQKLTQEYFKKSTTFRNEFTRLDHINKLHTQLKKIQKQVKQQTTKKVGQALLQNDYGSSHNNDQNKEVIAKEYTLSQVKQEIYRAAARKKETFRGNNLSPGKFSNKRHTESLYIEPALSSKRAYLDQNRRLKEQSLNLNIYQQLSRQISHNQLVLQERSGNIAYEYHYKKPDLIKQVNQRLQAQKQYQKALLKQLIKEEQLQQSIILNQKQRILGISPTQDSASRKYQRYDRKTKPFVLGNGQPERMVGRQRSHRKMYKYADSQLQGDRRQSPEGQRRRERSPYVVQSLRRDKTPSQFNRRQNTFPTNPFNQAQNSNDQPNQLSHQTTNKAHDNLTKYKQRKRENQTPQNRIKNHENRYSYLKENQEQQENRKQGEDSGDNGNPQTNEIKLFDREKSYKKSHNHTSQLSNNRNISQRIGEQLFKRDSLGMNTKSNNPAPRDNTQSPIRGMEGHYVLQDNKPNRYQPTNNSYLKSYSPFTKNRRVNMGNDYSERRDTTPIKMKRTFNYVE